jgi:Domain of unknown function (DUF4157)
MASKAAPQSKTSGPVPAPKTAHRASSEAPLGAIPTSLPAAGNQAIGRLLQAAAGDAGAPLDQSVRDPLERHLGVNLGNVRVHEGRNAEAAAQGVGARAYTVGSDVYLGQEAHGLAADARRTLLTHEAVHTVQQGGARVPLAGSMPVSSPDDAAEHEAREVAHGSPALALRDAMRVTHVAPHIQRDITGSKKWPQGEFVINFKKTDGKVAGDTASEDGTVTFTPSATAPESDHIKFIQIARTFDTSTGKEFDWSKTTEATRNTIQTKRDVKKNIAPGFYLDAIHASLAPRTKKADPTGSAFYMDTPPALARNKEGKRRGKTIEPAALDDTPGFSGPLKFNLVSVAKGADNGIVYGTVLWGFETFRDKGVAKIRNEYKSFRVVQGETFDAALQNFNEFYKNPGSAGAPTK